MQRTGRACSLRKVFDDLHTGQLPFPQYLGKKEGAAVVIFVDAIVEFGLAACCQWKDGREAGIGLILKEWAKVIINMFCMKDLISAIPSLLSQTFPTISHQKLCCLIQFIIATTGMDDTRTSVPSS